MNPDGGWCRECQRPMFKPVNVKRFKPDGKSYWTKVVPEHAPEGYVKQHREHLCRPCYERVRSRERRAHVPTCINKTPDELAAAQAVATKRRAEVTARRQADFIQDYREMKREGLSDVQVAHRMGRVLESLHNKLNRLDVFEPDPDERLVMEWVRKYSRRGIEFTADSLPFVDSGVNQRVLAVAERRGLIKNTGRKRKQQFGSGRAYVTVWQGVPGGR